ncbi:hypothetical protein V5799_022363 [Amblyomma americanum]|uniref:Uncharacterized protein n=1 Tax=Amblyomma americanum TaxID=6943 RepID=A0AAQ4FL36_AMBAM
MPRAVLTAREIESVHRNDREPELPEQNRQLQHTIQSKRSKTPVYLNQPPRRRYWRCTASAHSHFALHAVSEETGFESALLCAGAYILLVSAILC